MTMPARPSSPHPTQPPNSQEANRRPAFWLVWLATFACLLPFVFTSHYGVDEFQFLYEAKQVAQGAVPYRDYFEFIMPGSFLLLGAWFKLVGPSLLAARLLQAVLLATLGAIAWRLTRALGVGPWLAFVPPMALVWVMLPRSFGFSHHWLAQAGVGVALWLAWRAMKRSDALAWGWVGLAVGATYAMQQLDGAALLAGLGCWALWLSWRQRWGAAMTLRRAAWFLAGVALPLALLALYFVSQGALGTAAWATHVWPLSQYRGAGNHNDVAYATDLASELATTGIWLSRGYWYAGLALALVGTFMPLGVCLAGIAWLGGLGRSHAVDDDRVSLAAALLFVAGFMFLAACRGRADLPHLLFMELPHWVLLTAAVAHGEQVAHGAGVGVRGLRWLPRLGLVAVVLAGAFRVAEVARRMPEAWLRLESPDRRIQATPALATIAAGTRPGDTLLTVPIGAVFYFYVAPNASRYSYWVRPEDGYTTPAQHAEILEAVRRKQPRFLIVTTHAGRANADVAVREFHDRYVFDRELPYPSWEPRIPFKLYVYRLRESAERPLGH